MFIDVEIRKTFFPAKQLFVRWMIKNCEIEFCKGVILQRNFVKIVSITAL